MDRALQKIFTEHFTGYASAHKLSKDHWQAARQFMQCRRPELGGHVEFCPEGHVSKVHCNSCRHHSCPQCNALQIALKFTPSGRRTHSGRAASPLSCHRIMPHVPAPVIEKLVAYRKFLLLV